MFLVTGASGQLGSELRGLLTDRAVYAGRADLDITDESAVRAFFATHHFEMVINCAAYTAVDKAEDDAAEIIILSIDQLNPQDFGLPSIRKAIERYKNHF